MRRSDSGSSSGSTDSNEKSRQIKILQEKVNEIKTAKKSFLEQFSIISNDIDSMSRSLSVSIQTRRHVLQSLLQEIGNSKLLDWDRQLSICQEAKDKMRSLDSRVFNAVGLVQNISDHFAGKIGLIDAGVIEFDIQGAALLERVRSYGCLTVNNPLLEVKPKVILPDRFEQPSGLCCDSTGRILVSDCGNNSIQVFSEFGEFLFSFGKTGSNPGEFNSPTGVTTDKCRILVSDKDNNRIQIFTLKGSFLHTFGERGTKPGQFQQPLDVAVNENADIAVSDSKNHRIQLFNSQGRFIAEFGCNTTLGLNISPWGIVFKPDNNLLVTDHNSNSIYLIGKGFSTVSEFKPEKSPVSPRGIACNKNDQIAVADGRNSIQVYDSGKLCWSFEGFESLEGICFQGDRAVAVVGNNRIQVFPIRFVIDYFRE